MEPSRRAQRPATVRAARTVLAGGAAALLLGWSAAAPAAAETVEFTIDDSRITESSGLATDTDGQRYWTVNDSGDSGVAYALDESGQVTGTLEFRAQPVDIEAVAFHDGRLYVADIGDNDEQRELVTVYFFDDAEPTAQPVVYKSYDFSYPDGAHNAETLLVDGDGRLFIVTKGTKGGIYAAPKSPSRQGVNELERVGDAPAYVTDGTVLQDGKLALRTYLTVDILDPKSYEVTARETTPVQKQGESITTTFDGDALLIGSEGKRSKVLRIDVPTTLGGTPTPTDSPSPSPTQATSSPSEKPAPSATAPATATGATTATAVPAEDEDVPEDTGTAESSPAGTLAAIGLALVVAVTAAGVVVFARRP